jgi:hypothetical protein
LTRFGSIAWRLEPQSGTNIALKCLGLDNSGALAMATQIVMDRTGDTRHHFDNTDVDALSKAEERFERLTGLGFTAAVRSASGGVAVTRTFDANAEETLFFPRLVGG